MRWKTGKEQGEKPVNFFNLCFSSNNQVHKIVLTRQNVSMQTVCVEENYALQILNTE